VPQKPTDKLEGYVEGQAGDYKMWRIQGVLNVPISNTVRLRVAVDRNKRDGYMKNHSGIGTDSYNDINYFYARAGLSIDFTPDLENYTLFHYSNSFGKNYGARIVACNPQGGLSGGGIFTALPACDQINRQNARGDGALDVDINNPNPYMHIKQWQLINTTTWKATDNLTIKNIASMSEYRERGTFSLNGDNFTSHFDPRVANFLPFPHANGVPFDYILLNPQPTDSQAGQRTFTEELQFQGHNGKLEWQAGGYMEISRPIGYNVGYTGILLNCTDVTSLACTNPFSSGSVSGSRTKFYFDNYGLFAQGTYKFSDQFSVTAGIRYTWDKTSAFSESVRIAPQSNGTYIYTCNDVVHFFNGRPGVPLVVQNESQCHYGPPDAKSSAPTWVIGLDYYPNRDIHFYGKYSRGYRAGGLNLTTVGYEGWGPEKVDAYEIGAKLSFHGAVSGYFNIAGFYNDLTNMQVQVTGISNVSGFSGAVPEVNAGKAKIAGIEVDSAVNLFRGFKLEVGYTYLDTKLKSLVVPPIPAGAPYSAFIPTAVVGGPLAQSPKNRVSISGTYTLPLDDSIGKISLGMTYVHTDQQVVSQATLGAPQYAAGVTPVLASFLSGQPDFRYLPATDIVNLNVNWDNAFGKPIDLAFFVTNLTNDIYPVGLGQSWNSAGFESWVMGQPRMWGFKVRYRFGGD
jgi:iron complex outermembrane receptor protein